MQCMYLDWLRVPCPGFKKKKNKHAFLKKTEDFPGGPGVRNPLANAGDMGLIPGLGSCLGAAKSCTTTPETQAH